MPNDAKGRINSTAAADEAQSPRARSIQPPYAIQDDPHAITATDARGAKNKTGGAITANTSHLVAMHRRSNFTCPESAPVGDWTESSYT
jgi:hypothetical protein